MNIETFEHSGYPCVVVLTDMDHYCGYVGIPKSHPFFKKNYLWFEQNADELIDVHGGVTYSEYTNPATRKDDKDTWWLGFDCAHPGDWAPQFTMFVDLGAHRWTFDEVKEETERFAEQLRGLEDIEKASA